MVTLLSLSTLASFLFVEPLLPGACFGLADYADASALHAAAAADDFMLLLATLTSLTASWGADDTNPEAESKEYIEVSTSDFFFFCV